MADAEGAGLVRRALHDWLSDMNLVPASESAVIDRYIGYYKPYATSHDDLDDDRSIFEETRNAARALINAVADLRAASNPPTATSPIRGRNNAKLARLPRQSVERRRVTCHATLLQLNFPTAIGAGETRPQRLRQGVNFDETDADSVVLSSYDRRVIAGSQTHPNG